MKASVIQQILKQYGKAEQKGAELHISAGMEAHLIVAVGSEAITVQKVTSFEIHDEFVVASTFKGEKFFFSSLASSSSASTRRRAIAAPVSARDSRFFRVI